MVAGIKLNLENEESMCSPKQGVTHNEDNDCFFFSYIYFICKPKIETEGMIIDND